MQHITLVKKVLVDGRACSRCRAVSEQLRNDGLMHHINYLVIADDNDADSIGVRLAQRFAIEQVPFFLVENEHGDTKVFQDYQQFKQFLL